MGKPNSNNKLPKDQYNPCLIQTDADLFELTASRCGNEHDQTTNQNTMWLAIPEAVNRAFACELYMKAILCVKQASFFGHNLKELFNQLPTSIQEEITSLLAYPKDDFESKLEKASCIFEECRYVYEYSSMRTDILFLRKLSNALHAVSHRLILPIYLESEHLLNDPLRALHKSD